MGNQLATITLIGHDKAGVIAHITQLLFQLGANIEAENETQLAQAGGRFAVAVVMVIEDSPAARADVRPGDLIVAVEGETFTNLQDYQAKINAHAGGLVHLGLQRGRTEKTVEARLNSLPHS